MSIKSELHSFIRESEKTSESSLHLHGTESIEFISQQSEDSRDSLNAAYDLIIDRTCNPILENLDLSGITEGGFKENILNNTLDFLGMSVFNY